MVTGSTKTCVCARHFPWIKGTLVLSTREMERMTALTATLPDTIEQRKRMHRSWESLFWLCCLPATVSAFPGAIPSKHANRRKWSKRANYSNNHKWSTRTVPQILTKWELWTRGRASHRYFKQEQCRLRSCKLKIWWVYAGVPLLPRVNLCRHQHSNLNRQLCRIMRRPTW